MQIASSANYKRVSGSEKQAKDEHISHSFSISRGKGEIIIHIIWAGAHSFPHSGQDFSPLNEGMLLFSVLNELLGFIQDQTKKLPP